MYAIAERDCKMNEAFLYAVDYKKNMRRNSPLDIMRRFIRRRKVRRSCQLNPVYRRNGHQSRHLLLIFSLVNEFSVLLSSRFSGSSRGNILNF